MPSVDDVLASIETAMPAARDALDDLVRIPSISADPDRAPDVRASAEATAALLERSGLERVRLDGVEGSHPYVRGEWTHAGPGRPTVLLYAHHDVQPAGDVSRWTTDPFEPCERKGRLYGRGSADDKAGAVAHATAVSAWLQAHGELPCNVRVLVEGEEEIGSPNLQAYLVSHLDDLRADFLVLADAGNWSVGVPGITYSLRGLAGADVELRALEGPVHSGMGGGAIPDPVLGLARILASLVDDHGSPAIDGLDAPRPLTDEELSPLAGLDDEPERFARAMGVLPGVEVVGDPAIPLRARIWLRPAVTVTGIDGHPIKGSSNQIVARAAARVSLRLAPGQDPAQVVAALRAHVEARVPWGLDLRFRAHEGSPAWETDPTGPAFEATARALRTGFGVDPVFMGVGGSIPFVGPFADAFGGIPALLLGPADPASRIHGEDESLHLDDWRKLVRSEACLLTELTELTELPEQAAQPPI
jgi:acetylornithine deacetylase/succinyl-diaminopimelate desuccinylase-like protein